jgi:hypothetical protein
MSTYSIAIATHVVVAVLGIGSLASIPITAGFARRASIPLSVSGGIIQALLRFSRWSLAIVFVSGALLDLSVGGAFHSSSWFRASVVLMLFLGFSHARAMRRLRVGLASGIDEGGTLRAVQRWGWTMCATVGVVVVLMEWKPVL